MDEDFDSQELSAEQLARARREEQLAQTAEDQAEVAAHARRADKARYLQEQLEQRRSTERED